MSWSWRHNLWEQWLQWMSSECQQLEWRESKSPNCQSGMWNVCSGTNLNPDFSSAFSSRKASAGNIKWLVLFVYWRILAGQTYKYLQTHSQTAKYPQNCNVSVFKGHSVCSMHCFLSCKLKIIININLLNKTKQQKTFALIKSFPFHCSLGSLFRKDSRGQTLFLKFSNLLSVEKF